MAGQFSIVVSRQTGLSVVSMSYVKKLAQRHEYRMEFGTNVEHIAQRSPTDRRH